MGAWEPVLWLVAAVILVGVELLTVQMVSVWFAVGAAGALLVSLTGLPLVVQCAVFLLVSCVSLILSRPLARRLTKRGSTHTNADAVIGMTGTVTEAVDNIQEAGRVNVNGLSWSARSQSGEPLAAGSRVLVVRIDGVKLLVTPSDTITEQK